MEQTPMRATEPLEPPAADVARAYLDEAESLEERREARIDRRMLGWLHLTDGLVVGALFSAALFVMRSDASQAHLWLLVLVALIIWMEFAGQVRDRLGVRLPWFRSWSLPYLAVFIPTLVIAWALPTIPQPSLLLVLAPIGISVVVFGVLAARQWRRARAQNQSSMRDETEPFTRKAAVATVAAGVILAALVIAAGVSEQTGATIALVLLCVLLVVTIATRTGSWVPVLGRVWLRPQWAALIIAGVLFVASLVLSAAVPTARLPVAAATGAFTMLLFVTVAVWGLRRTVGQPDRDVEIERRG